MKEFLIAASRGRDPDNSNDCTRGRSTKQKLEINKLGVCNTLTTALKDNYVIEVIRVVNDTDPVTINRGSDE